MRTEIREFIKKNPYPKWKAFLMRLQSRLIIFLFDKKLNRLKLGSPEWHMLQEKLSNLSSAGIDRLKRNKFYSKTLTKCGKNLFIHPKVIFCYPQNIQIGDNVFINRGTFFTAPVEITIGNDVLIGPYVMFNSGSHLYSSRSTLIGDQEHKYGKIIIEDDVWIGGHACILPGVVLGKGCVVAANAVVTKSVKPYTVVAGVPAIKIKERNAT